MSPVYLLFIGISAGGMEYWESSVDFSLWMSKGHSMKDTAEHLILVFFKITSLLPW